MTPDSEKIVREAEAAIEEQFNAVESHAKTGEIKAAVGMAWALGGMISQFGGLEIRRGREVEDHALVARGCFDTIAGVSGRLTLPANAVRLALNRRLVDRGDSE